jgi:hypothetical protein
VITTILVLAVANTILQAVAVYQRHATLQHQKRNGGAS